MALLMTGVVKIRKSISSRNVFNRDYIIYSKLPVQNIESWDQLHRITMQYPSSRLLQHCSDCLLWKGNIIRPREKERMVNQTRS